jgi:hypothetical protein
VVGVIVALCAVLLLKWLALVALVAIGLFAFVRWARGERPVPVVEREIEVHADPVPAPRPAPSADDCTWCGLAGGHRDVRGRLLRPRHVHT